MVGVANYPDKIFKREAVHWFERSRYQFDSLAGKARFGSEERQQKLTIEVRLKL